MSHSCVSLRLKLFEKPSGFCIMLHSFWSWKKCGLWLFRRAPDTCQCASLHKNKNLLCRKCEEEEWGKHEITFKEGKLSYRKMAKKKKKWREEVRKVWATLKCSEGGKRFYRKNKKGADPSGNELTLRMEKNKESVRRLVILEQRVSSLKIPNTVHKPLWSLMRIGGARSIRERTMHKKPKKWAPLPKKVIFRNVENVWVN